MEIYTVKSAKRGFTLRPNSETDEGEVAQLTALGFKFDVDDGNIAWVVDEPVINIDEDSKFLTIITIFGGEVAVSKQNRTITIFNDYL